MMEFGTAEELRLEVRWDNAEPPITAADATAGWLRLSIAGVKVWGGEPGNDEPGLWWTWIDLLEQLARAWPRLRFEQRDPLGLDFDLPSLRQRARERWAREESIDVDAEQRTLWAFLNAHDLGAELGGITLPAVFLLREGCRMRAWSGDEIARLPLDSTLDTLEGFAAAICARLARVSDGRSRAAIEAWRRRNVLEEEPFVRIATGLAERQLVALTHRKSLAEVFGLDHVRNDNELLAVARMSAGVLPTADVARLLTRVRAIEAVVSQTLDRDAKRAGAELDSLSTPKAHEQGLGLARWFRKELRAGDQRVDPHAILADWRVSVHEVEFASNLEAISVWGPAHGPAVLLNVAGRRSSSAEGRSATLAHEVAHLLVDRADALPLAEVLGGRAPSFVESRANAFAAELLMPRAVASTAFAGKVNPKAVLERLRKRFGASREIIAWQTLRSDARLSVAARAHLLALLPADRRYQVEAQ